jgi:hypothetical protein
MTMLQGRCCRLGSGKGRCRRPGEFSFKGYSDGRWSTHRDGTPGETVDGEASSYAHPTISAIWRGCIFLLVSYVIDFYCGRFGSIWWERRHGMVVSIGAEM